MKCLKSSEKENTNLDDEPFNKHSSWSLTSDDVKHDDDVIQRAMMNHTTYTQVGP
jgi:hypothetical protein